MHEMWIFFFDSNIFFALFYLQNKNINGLSTRLRDQANDKMGTTSTDAQTNQAVYTKEKIVLLAKRNMITVCAIQSFLKMLSILFVLSGFQCRNFYQYFLLIYIQSLDNTRTSSVEFPVANKEDCWESCDAMKLAVCRSKRFHFKLLNQQP